MDKWAKKKSQENGHFVAWMTHLRPWWKIHIHISDGWRKTVRIGQRDKAWGNGTWMTAWPRHGENAWV